MSTPAGTILVLGAYAVFAVVAARMIRAARRCRPSDVPASALLPGYPETAPGQRELTQAEVDRAWYVIVLRFRADTAPEPERRQS